MKMWDQIRANALCDYSIVFRALMSVRALVWTKKVSDVVTGVGVSGVRVRADAGSERKAVVASDPAISLWLLILVNYMFQTYLVLIEYLKNQSENCINKKGFHYW